MRALLLAGVTMLGFSGSARAALITEDFMFSLGGFVDANGSLMTPPVSVITGSFTLTFDPKVEVDASTVGISNVSVTTLAPASNYRYGVSPFFSLLSFDQSLSNIPVMFTGQAGLAVLIDVSNPYLPSLSTCYPNNACGVLTGNPSYTESGYSLPGVSGTYYAATSQSFVTASQISLAVPEPTSLALLALPLGVAGVLTMRRQRDDAGVA